MKRLRAVLLLIIVIPGLLGFPASRALVASAQAGIQQPTVEENVQTLFDSMSAEERVGQLFLISFQGTDVGADSSIYNLIKNFHIGGVILMASNNNFTGSADVAGDAYAMISHLQHINWSDPAETGAAQPTSSSKPYIPLLVALSQEGDGYPND
ncbi:MAG: hypothetical protein AAGU05_11825, partial [Anaerolineaceae bacterium]